LKKILLIAFLIIISFNLIIAAPTLAANPTEGSKIFNANCAVCHKSGKNVVVAYKTLKKEALAKYLKGFNQNAEAAVVYQVTHGKNAMPSFKGYLQPAEVESVAAYVVQQAQKGW
jgi:cytochrome c6